MTIFGDMTCSNGTLLHTGTPWDTMWNYLFGVTLLGLFGVSLLCNPLVFVENYRKSNNTTTLLFQILTTNDFLTCLVAIPYLLYLIFSPSYHPGSEPSEPWQIYYSVIRDSLFQWSIWIGAVLGVVRALGILHPFTKLTTSCVIVTLLSGAVVTSATMILHVILTDPAKLRWNLYTQHVISFSPGEITITAVIVYVNYVLVCMVSFGSAISSMWALHKVHEERQKQGLMPGNECPACFTVMIINIMMCCQFMISSVSLGVAWGAPGDVVLVHYLEFLQFPLSNCALSAFNPVIILVRSGGMKKLKLFKRKLTVSTIISSRNT